MPLWADVAFIDVRTYCCRTQAPPLRGLLFLASVHATRTSRLSLSSKGTPA